MKRRTFLGAVAGLAGLAAVVPSLVLERLAPSRLVPIPDDLKTGYDPVYVFHPDTVAHLAPANWTRLQLLEDARLLLCDDVEVVEGPGRGQVRIVARFSRDCDPGSHEVRCIESRFREIQARAPACVEVRASLVFPHSRVELGLDGRRWCY